MSTEDENTDTATEDVEQQSASSSEPPAEVNERPAEDAGTRVTRTLGAQRWVQFAWIVAAVVLFWLVSNLIRTVWDYFEEPRESWISIGAAAFSLISALLMYRNDRIRGFTTEVVNELRKVVWPNREETWSQTVVVVIVSIITAIILATMDFAWGKLTDFIYTPGVGG